MVDFTLALDVRSDASAAAFLVAHQHMKLQMHARLPKVPRLKRKDLHAFPGLGRLGFMFSCQNIQYDFFRNTISSERYPF